MALTSKKIAALKPTDKRFSIADGNGLTLRVHPSGAKSWVFRFHHSGRVVDETIGKWPEMSLKQARQVVRNRRKEAGLTPPPWICPSRRLQDLVQFEKGADCFLPG